MEVKKQLSERYYAYIFTERGYLLMKECSIFKNDTIKYIINYSIINLVIYLCL